MRQFGVSIGVFWLERIVNTNHLVERRLSSFDLWSMTPFSRSKAAGQMIGASFSAWAPTITGEREDQLLGRSALPSRAALGSLSGVPGGYVAEGIDRLTLSLLHSPATPSWPPPGARVDTPRGAFWSALDTMTSVLVLTVSFSERVYRIDHLAAKFSVLCLCRRQRVGPERSRQRQRSPSGDTPSRGHQPHMRDIRNE